MRNTVLTFLLENEKQLGLSRFGDPVKFRSVIATPRFRASSHLIFFILAENTQPVLIAKVPRLAGDHKRLLREANNLNQLHALWTGCADSAPSMIAFEDYCGHRMLIETAISGQTMRPAFVRGSFETARRVGLDWLTNLHLASAASPENREHWFETCVQSPLQLLELLASDASEDAVMLTKTLELAERLRWLNLPAVFEHGDFGSPNLLISKESQLGVVDWELAIPQGLPAVDMFFFMSYLAFAREDATALKSQMLAFENAFFGKEAWTASEIGSYFNNLKLPTDGALALFVVCWARYVASLLQRLGACADSNSLPSETLGWLRNNRYYHMWRLAVGRLDDLQWSLNS